MKKQKVIISVIVFLICFAIVAYFTGWLDTFLGRKFVISEINLELIKCPAGTFTMGSPKEELGRAEKPKYVYWDSEELHSVCITKPFYIGKYEITQSLYIALMDKNPSKYVGINNPIDSVTYDEAKAFCDKLNLKYLNQLPQGYKFDLPTEAQWEYACRAGTNTALNNGKNLTNSKGTCPNLDEVAWYEENSNKTTHPIGQKKPNAWGIYDMHGNVYEWCRDYYGEYPNSAVTDPIGKKSYFARVIRGGGFDFSADYCRSARRGQEDDDHRFYMLGFRVALVPVE